MVIEAAMDKKHQRLLLSVLLIALVQLSCSEYEFIPDDRTDRERDRDDCEELGGIWHEGGHPLLGAWCEMPPTPTAAPPPTPTATITPEFDITLCDAREVVQVTITLENDSTSASGRFCWYDMEMTNTSSQVVAFYVYVNRADSEGKTEPRWSLMYLDPGEVFHLQGNGSFVTSGSWSYNYLEKAAAVYYDIDYCGHSGLGIDYNDEAGTAEQFDWEIDEVYCQR